MKVLYVLQGRNLFSYCTNIVGGHIAHIIGVVEALQRLGHEVVIASFDRVPYWDNSDIRYFQFKGQDIPIPKVRGVITHWQMKKQIVRAVQEENPEVVYIRWSGHISRDISKAFPNIPIVIECNTAAEMPFGLSHPRLHRKWLAHRVDKINTKSATLISAVSRETKDFLLEHHPELDPLRVIVNPNGVDVNRFFYTESDVRARYQIPQDAIVIGYAGNFLTFHRIDLLIKAFQQLDLAGVYL
jgi:glycosyltransferase involved in cell wall biosynthesis